MCTPACWGHHPLCRRTLRAAHVPACPASAPSLPFARGHSFPLPPPPPAPPLAPCAVHTPRALISHWHNPQSAGLLKQSNRVFQQNKLSWNILLCTFSKAGGMAQPGSRKGGGEKDEPGDSLCNLIVLRKKVNTANKHDNQRGELLARVWARTRAVRRSPGCSL